MLALGKGIRQALEPLGVAGPVVQQVVVVAHGKQRFLVPWRLAVLCSQLGDAGQHLANDALAALDGAQQVEALCFQFGLSRTRPCQGRVRRGRPPPGVICRAPADDGAVALVPRQARTQSPAVFRRRACVLAPLAKTVRSRQPPVGGRLGIGVAHARPQAVELLLSYASLVAERVEIIGLAIERDGALELAVQVFDPPRQV